MKPFYRHRHRLSPLTRLGTDPDASRVAGRGATVHLKQGQNEGATRPIAPLSLYRWYTLCGQHQPYRLGNRDGGNPAAEEAGISRHLGLKNCINFDVFATSTGRPGRRLLARDVGSARGILPIDSSHRSATVSLSGMIASTGHSGSHTPQSMHSSGWIDQHVLAVQQSIRGTSTQSINLQRMQASVTMNKGRLSPARRCRPCTDHADIAKAMPPRKRGWNGALACRGYGRGRQASMRPRFRAQVALLARRSRQGQASEAGGSVMARRPRGKSRLAGPLSAGRSSFQVSRAQPRQDRPPPFRRPDAARRRRLAGAALPSSA